MKSSSSGSGNHFYVNIDVNFEHKNAQNYIAWSSYNQTFRCPNVAWLLQLALGYIDDISVFSLRSVKDACSFSIRIFLQRPNRPIIWMVLSNSCFHPKLDGCLAYIYWVSMNILQNNCFFQFFRITVLQISYNILTTHFIFPSGATYQSWGYVASTQIPCQDCQSYSRSNPVGRSTQTTEN